MIWVLAGTKDGREIAASLANSLNQSVLVSVVSEYGKQLAELPNVQVLVGKFDTAAMIKVIDKYGITLLVDASHPYAVQVTASAEQACLNVNIVYLRYERPSLPLPDYAKLVVVPTASAAAQAAADLGEVVFLTTGSRTLAVFAKHPALANRRLIARVLPDIEVLTECLALGFTPQNIVALQGPFSHRLNVALFADYGADVIIMKNSGIIGGSDSKLAAAMELGLAVVVIDRPQVANKLPTRVFSDSKILLEYIEEVYP
jgi:precorrin-6A/cobalt-precorrin-6A reductase